MSLNYSLLLALILRINCGGEMGGGSRSLKTNLEGANNTIREMSALQSVVCVRWNPGVRRFRPVRGKRPVRQQHHNRDESARGCISRARMFGLVPRDNQGETA